MSIYTRYCDKNQIKFYRPENYDPARLPEDLEPHADYIGYFLNLICFRSGLRYTTQNGFVPLKRAYLETVIPRKLFSRIKEYLLAEGIIETDGYYCQGKKSYGYRLTSKAPAKLVKCNDNKLARKLRKISKAKTLDPVSNYLAGWLKLLEVDQSQAQQLLEQFPDEGNKIQNIQEKEFSVKVCKYGRVHTPVTNLKRELRETLTIDGKTLHEIDIATSQPLFLAALVINYRTNSNKFNLKELQLSTLPTPSITNVNRSKDIASIGLSVDERLYIQLAQSGELYDYLLNKLKAEGLTRNRFKEEFYQQVFFGRLRANGEVKELFQAEFPHVWEVIKAAKRKDYRHLAQRLQRAESNLLIQSVCRTLKDHFPHVPVVTVHDSILTTAENIPLVKFLITEAFNQIGLGVTLKLKGPSEALGGPQNATATNSGSEADETPIEISEGVTVPLWLLPEVLAVWRMGTVGNCPDYCEGRLAV